MTIKNNQISPPDQVIYEELGWILKARFIAGLATFLSFGFVRLIGLFEYPFWLFAIAPLFEMFINQPYGFIIKTMKKPENLGFINQIIDVLVITYGIYFVGGMDMFVGLLSYPLVIINASILYNPRRSYIIANQAWLCYAVMVYLEYNNIIPHIPAFDINISGGYRLLYTLLVWPSYNLIAFHTSLLSSALHKKKEDLHAANLRLQQENNGRLQTEKALIESKEKYKSIFESFIDLYYQTDISGKVTNISPSCYRLSGFTPEEIIGKEVSLFYPQLEQRQSLLKQLLQNGVVNDFEITLRVKDGRSIPVSVNSRVIYNNENQPIRIEGTIRDIAARKQVEDKLRELSARNEAILDAIPDIIMEVDNDKIYTWANPAGFEFFGPDVIGQPAEKYFEGEQDTYDIVKPLFNGNHDIIYVESWQRRKDGQKRLLAWWCRVLKDSANQVIGALSSARDITEIRLSEKRFLQSEQKYHSFIESMRDGVGYVDPEENILFANMAMCDILGYSQGELLGMNLRQIVAESDIDIILAGARRGLSKEHDKYVITVIRKDGQPRQISISVTPLLDDNGRAVGSVGIFTDISEIIKAEEEKKLLKDKLIRAQRMESLGVLAGGVAHDLNNILGPLVAYPEIIRTTIPPDSPIREHLQKIEGSAQRAAGVVQDLLTMARRGRYEMLPMNLNTAIEDYLYSPDFANIKKKFPDVKLEIQLDKLISPIHGSQTHISKVVMNLVINALEAMPHGGVLAVKTKERYIEKLAGGFDNIETGEYVIMSISDTGLGIEEKDMKRLFEPFYTKKEMGRSGSGLGLAIVYGVLKDHNGYVDVISKVNQGSHFLVYLPVLKVSNIATQKIVVDIRGNEKILVVDDLEEQRELAATMLSSLGYKVELAPEGKSAIEYLQNNNVDLVILDMIMENDFDGLDTYREIVKLHPGQKAIIASGFSQTDRVKEAEKLGVNMYIRKPYTMQKLGKAIREVLAGR